MKHIDLNNSGKDIQDVYHFLRENKIPAVFPNVGDNEYCRELSFKLNDIWYTIVWFKNESMLWFGEKHESACVPFRYMYIDTTFPIVGGNMSLAFSYDKMKVESVFDRMFPYAVVRIPMKNQ